MVSRKQVALLHSEIPTWQHFRYETINTIIEQLYQNPTHKLAETLYFQINTTYPLLSEHNAVYYAQHIISLLTEPKTWVSDSFFVLYEVLGKLAVKNLNTIVPLIKAQFIDNPPPVSTTPKYSVQNKLHYMYFTLPDQYGYKEDFATRLHLNNRSGYCLYGDQTLPEAASKTST